MEQARRGIRTTFVGVLANIGLALIKAAAGFAGNSYALIADAVESLADVFTSLVVAAGLKISIRPPDDNHPYGHGKAEPLVAVVVAAGLFLAAIAISVQSVREIRTPHHAPAPFTLIVLILVVAAKESLYRYVVRVGEAVSSSAVKTDAWHHRSDAITSLAAFIGISVALVGGRGYESADDWAALFASGIIAFNAFRLLRPALYELTDAAPAPEVLAEIHEVAGKVPGVRGTDKCFVRKMGLAYYIDLEILVDGDASVRAGHRIAHAVQDALRSANPAFHRAHVHVEPDV